MANIQISALLPVGYDLLNDAASFLNELATEEIQNVLGGGHHCCLSHNNNHHSNKGYSNNSWGY